MKQLVTGIFAALVISLAAWADHDHLLWSPQGLPVDDQRGPWFSTIDLGAIDWAIERQREVVRKGDTALRFEVREGDCFTAFPHDPASGWDDCTRDRERSEIREKWSPPLDTEVWYKWSMFIPEDYAYMYPKQIFFQWHGGDWGPNVYFQLNRKKFLVDILTEQHQTTTQYEIGELPSGRWLDFTVRAIWSDQENGALDIWIDDITRPRAMVYPYLGIQVLDHRGATMDKTTVEKKGVGPHTKMGIYRSHMFRWYDRNGDTPPPTQILYFDEYRRGMTYDEVAIEGYSGD